MNRRRILRITRSIHTGTFWKEVTRCLKHVCKFLPTTKQELRGRGHQQARFCFILAAMLILIILQLGSAIITRLLESRGYSVGIISLPDWTKPESVQVFGEPRLAFRLIRNMDSW